MTELTIFFATDVHGSEKCFSKFLNAHKVYGVDVLILGGDMTGKAIVPIVEQPDGSYRSEFLGGVQYIKTSDELEKLEKKISDMGYYPYRTTLEEREELMADKQKMSKLFVRLIVERIEKWVKMADARLANTEVMCYVCPGNDDFFEIDPILEKSERIINCEGKVINLDEQHEMISTGFSNKTPWNCPRDITEEELAQKIDSMVGQVRDLENCIFNFHCPPYNTPLDNGPLLDDNQNIVFGLDGRPAIASVGSTAVRNSIETYQPLLGLHGHIHESRGVTRIGRTLCINPGSEYQEGILRGALIKLKSDIKKVKSYLLVYG